MTLNLSIPNTALEIKPRITVIGVGGAGGNAVNNMIKSNLEGVDFLVCNTDAQALSQSICERRIQLGVNITQGLGAGARPDIGRAAAEEVLDDLIGQLQGSNMVFITAGMGGGTGTGGAPVIARAAREQGILTVGVVTKPFHFEGLHRMRVAESGIQELQQFVDTLIIIPNQNLFRVATERTTFADAFNMADEVLHSGVRGVTDLMVMPGLINLDFADIRSVMTEMGKAMMGTGEADGENRAVAAAEAAISNPLLDDVSMKGARGVLINITGGLDMTLFEVDEAANRIRDEVDPDANIIFGSTFNANLEGKVRISVVATGIDSEAGVQPRPALSLVTTRGGRVVSAPSGEVPAAGEPPAARPAAAAAAAMAARPVAERRIEPAPRTADAQATVATGAAARAAAAVAASTPVVGHAEAGRRDWVAPIQDGAATARQLTPESFAAPMPDEVTMHVDRPESAAVPAAADAAASRAAQAAAERPRGPGLFTRVTGTAAAWARQTASELSSPAGGGSLNRPVEPILRAPAAKPAAPAPASQPAPQPAVQQRLAGLDTRERLASARKEEDLLDIPAFLRRQAN